MIVPDVRISLDDNRFDRSISTHVYTVCDYFHYEDVNISSGDLQYYPDNFPHIYTLHDGCYFDNAVVSIDIDHCDNLFYSRRFVA